MALTHALRFLRRQPKPCWRKASKEQKNSFRINFKSNLEELAAPDCCDGYLLSLLKCLSTAANECLPTSAGRSKNNNDKKPLIPGWKKDIQPFKDSTMFWNAIWISAGKPLNTQLHNLMKKTRNIYHFHIRKGKRKINTLKKNSLLDACFGNQNMDIFTEIKKLRKCSSTVATTIGGMREDIPNHFANIYEDLYNSVSDEKEVQDFQLALKKRINQSSMRDVLKVTPSLIAEDVSHLKSGKSDPVFEFSSDCIKNVPTLFYEHLALVFRSFLIHGHISSVLMVSTLIPLLKAKLGDICASKTYRSIALSSLKGGRPPSEFFFAF